MRFSVFLSLVVAAFSVSCDSFVNAETDARDDHINKSHQLRRLPGGNLVVDNLLIEQLHHSNEIHIPPTSENGLPKVTTTHGGEQTTPKEGNGEKLLIDPTNENGEKTPIDPTKDNGEKMPNSPHPRPDIEDTKVISESEATNWLKMLINQFDDKDKAMMMKKGYDVDKLSSANEENLRVIAQLILKGTKAQKPTFRKVAEKTGIAIGTLAVVYLAYLLATGRVHSPTLAPVGTTTAGSA